MSGWLGAQASKGADAICFLSSVPFPSIVLGHGTLYSPFCVPCSPRRAGRSPLQECWDNPLLRAHLKEGGFAKATSKQKTFALCRLDRTHSLLSHRLPSTPNWPSMVLNSPLTGRRGFVICWTVCCLIKLTPCSLHSPLPTRGAFLAEPTPTGDAGNFIIRSKRREILSLHMLDKKN